MLTQIYVAILRHKATWVNLLALGTVFETQSEKVVDLYALNLKS